MTRRPRQNFSGSRAVLFHGLDRNRDALAEALVRLGLQVSCFEPGVEEASFSAAIAEADVFFFDGDCAETPSLPWADNPPIPIVATVGLETPGRLHRAFELGASAILHKPIRSSGIYAALFFAFNEHRRWTELWSRLTELESRHSARRFVQKAVLRMMDDHDCDDEEAYRLLRKESMRQRITVEELAVRILAREPHRLRGKI